MKDLISVVVPIYNVENYLVKCLDSIINQTYKNLEIILVDDGSIDNSGKIVDEYKSRDKRIKVIHKLNGGLSDARNKGIDIATGKYITFIDSDDYIDLDYVEYLYNLMKKHKTNISLCKYELIFNNSGNDSNKIRNNKKGLKDGKYSKIFIFNDILYSKNFEVSAWGKMYLTSQFTDVRFPKGKLFEDNNTIYKIIDKNEYIAIGIEKKYKYVMRNDSITKKEFNDNYFYLITAVDEMCNYLSKYNELEKAIFRRQFWGRISTFNRMINSKTRNYEKEKKLRNDILKYKKILFDKQSSIRDKVSILLLFMGTPIYKFTWNIYQKYRR